MLEEFNETFGLPKDYFIPIPKLEDALILKYGDLKFNYFRGFKSTNDYGEEEVYESNYSCMCGESWGSYKYETKEKYKTSKDALLGLFVENKNRLKGIVKEVCHVAKDKESV